MASTIVLYDIPTREPIRSWSPNTWKVRMVLNFKGIPYETKWVEYPDIKALGEKLGLKPNDDFPAYTLPTVTLPLQPDQSSPTAITDSTDIIKHLEKEHPAPSLHLDSPYLPRLRDAQMKMMPALRALVVTHVPDAILPLRSAAYFHETRSEAMGMPLAQFEKQAVDNGIWDVLKTGGKEIGEMLREDDGGVFFMGGTPGYADLIVGSYLEWTRLGNEEAFNVFLESGGDELRRLWEATAPWRERNDR